MKSQTDLTKKITASSRVSILSMTLSLLLLLSLSCVTAHRAPAPEEAGERSYSEKLMSMRMEGPRKRVLILPFLNDSAEKDPVVARTSRDALVQGMRLTDNFVILDNNDVGKDLKTFQKENGYDLDEVSKVAAELGIVAIIEGRVLEIKAKKSGDEVGLIRSVKAEVSATVGVKVYSVSSHKELLNEVRSATSQSKTHRVGESGRGYSLAADPELIRESLYTAFQGSILPIIKAVDKLSWSGKIALVSGDRLYLNAGRITGLNIGDILRVSEEGEEVYDSDTGMLIGKAPGRMKGTLEVVTYFGKDGAVAVVHSGSGFKENDHVELY